MKNLFDEDYYERGLEKGISGYSNYRWMPELTIPMCATLCDELHIHRQARVLDFGCAKGYIVRAMRLLRRDAWGVDISEYAVNQADPSTRPYVSTFMPSGRFHWAIAKDVFEHMEREDLVRTLAQLAETTEHLFVVVPLGGPDGKFVVPSYELDVTHVQRQPIEWWSELINSTGWKVQLASWQFFGIKENYAKWEKGNGFLVADSR